MRAIVAILLIAVICQGVFAVRSKSQSKMLLEKINSKLERSHLGRALKGMVTIATKLGYNYDDLFEAFNALKNSLLSKLDAENDLWEEVTAAHLQAVAQYNADIAQYQQELVDGEALLQRLNAEYTNFQGLLLEAQFSLSQNKEVLQVSQQALAELEEAYAAEVADYNNARDVISVAIEHLNEAQSHYENAELGGFSFVQLKNTFVSFAQKIQEATQNLKSKHQLFVKPVIQAMIQVKSSNNQSSIQVAINALRDLQAYFDKALNDTTSLYVSYKQSLEDAIASYTQVISILENETIPAYENNLNVLNGEIQIAEENQVISGRKLGVAKQGLFMENFVYEEAEVRHNALVERVNSEYDLVGQAERIIRTAQSELEQ